VVWSALTVPLVAREPAAAGSRMKAHDQRQSSSVAIGEHCCS